MDDVSSSGWRDNKAFWRDFKRDTPGAVLESDEDSDTDVDRLASEDSDDTIDQDRVPHQRQPQLQRRRRQRRHHAEVEEGGDENELFFTHCDDSPPSRSAQQKALEGVANDWNVVEENAAAGAADVIAADGTADDVGLADAPDAHPNLTRFRRIRREYRQRVRRRDRTMMSDYGEAAVHVTFYSIATLMLVHYVGYWKPMVDLARVEFRLIFVLAAFAIVLFVFEFFLACKPLFFTRRKGPTVAERPQISQAPTPVVLGRQSRHPEKEQREIEIVEAAAIKATKLLRKKGHAQDGRHWAFPPSAKMPIK